MREARNVTPRKPMPKPLKTMLIVILVICAVLFLYAAMNVGRMYELTINAPTPVAAPASIEINNVFADVNDDGLDDLIIKGNVVINKKKDPATQ